jgi:hypothetical protein
MRLLSLPKRGPPNESLGLFRRLNCSNRRRTDGPYGRGQRRGGLEFSNSKAGGVSALSLSPLRIISAWSPPPICEAAPSSGGAENIFSAESHAASAQVREDDLGEELRVCYVHSCAKQTQCHPLVTSRAVYWQRGNSGAWACAHSSWMVHKSSVSTELCSKSCYAFFTRRGWARGHGLPALRASRALIGAATSARSWRSCRTRAATLMPPPDEPHQRRGASGRVFTLPEHEG